MKSLGNFRFRLSTDIPFVALALSALPLSAAGASATQMPPYEVEAEFGVDGLRIQNSNSVLNQHLLEQHGVGRLQDVSGLAPNLYSSNSDARGFGDVISLRGMANSLFFSSPAIALYVDDVPGGSVSSYPSALPTVDSLIVKAGPQGTDYGRNAPGGVIDIRTRAPGNRHQGNLQVDVGSYHATSLLAAFDGPLGGKAGYSVSFSHAERDGFMENSFQHRTADDRQASAGRASLYLRPNETLQLRFGVFVEEVDDDAGRLSSLFSPDPFVVASDLNGVTSLDRLQFSFQIRRKFGWGSLIATTSQQDWELDPSSTDLDFSPFPAAYTQISQSEKTWTQEVRLESAPDSAWAQWRAGVFYFDSRIEGDALREFIVPPGPTVPPGFVQTERTVFELGQTNLAAYANLDRPLAEKTTLKFGVRADYTESDVDRTKTSSNSFGFPVPPDPRLDRSQSRGLLSATAGLVHLVSDSLSVQARVSVAQKPEGYSAYTASPQLARFDRERLGSGEVGLTFGPKEGRFGGSVLAFWNVSRDYQFERTVPNSTDFVVVNADEVTARGFEAKFMWNPVERLWWDFQAGYTAATFDAHADAAGNSLDGRRVPFIPRSTLRTGFTLALAKGLSANASYALVGRTFFDESNTAAFAQRAYGIVNAQLRYRYDRWSVTVYGHNLSGENYYQFINPEIFAGSPGAPRRFGVQLAFSY